MINLLEKIFDVIPYPVWMRTDSLLIYKNQNLENILSGFDPHITKANSKALEKFINRTPEDSDILVLDNLYNFAIIKEEIESKKIEIGILLDVDKGCEKVLRTIIDNIPELVFFKNSKCEYIGANRHCFDFYNSLGIKNIIGKRDMDLPLEKSFIETCAKHDNIVLSTGTPLHVEDELINSDGVIQIFETVKTPVFSYTGKPFALIGVARDVTEKRLEEKKLKYLSYRDPLTELYNRSYLTEKLSELSKSNAYPIGFIMGDVNGLKVINDTMGHLEGDKLILLIANILKENCSENEFVFRWGGDEFIILTPKGSEDYCEKLIDKINSQCESSKFNGISLSISMGFSILKNKDDEITDVLKSAEDMVYRRKILVSKSMRSSLINTLTETLNTKNVETKEHTERVEKLSLDVGHRLNLGMEALVELSLVARLHDIGKIGIPEDILLKPSKLTEEEFDLIKTHTEKGYRLALSIPEISHIAKGILTHHENWDGSGYPLGLKGEEIPISCRIVSIVDAFDAMTNKRPYNNPKEMKDAIEEIKRCSGKQFDPNIVGIFMDCLNKYYNLD